MQTRFQKIRSAWTALPATSFIIGALAVSVLMPVSADAQGFGFRAGGASGQNGAVAGSRGVISNGQGGGAIGRNFAIGDGQGNGASWSGHCAAYDNTAGCRGRAATWGSDGTFSGVAGTEVTGEDGFLGGSRTLDRDADGAWNGTSAVDASGQRGNYSGNATFEDGTYSRGATYSGNEGQSVTVDGDFEVGSGGSRSVTCIDASGAVVDCP